MDNNNNPINLNKDNNETNINSQVDNGATYQMPKNEAPQYGQPVNPQAPQYGQSVNPQAPQYGQPMNSQAPQYGQPINMNYQANMGMVQQESQGFGIASLVLGILSLLLTCSCFNYITGILAIIFGIVQIVKSKNNRGMAIAGLITAGISILVATFFWIFVLVVAEDTTSAFYRYFDSYRYKYMNEETDIDNWN